MIWLLTAEVRKLARPLVWGSALAVVAFLVLLTWAASNNARGALLSPRVPDMCVHSASTACRNVIGRVRADAASAAKSTSELARPGAVGQVAAGMLASLPGLLFVALLAGGHWGGEWGARTIRSLLTREGRRSRVLFAKWVTVWAAGVVTVLACWVVLAAAGPVIAAWSGLPSAGGSLWAGLGQSAAAVGRAALVLGLFSAIGIAAGTVARGQLATTAVAAGSMLAGLVLANAGALGAWSPATFVQSWMRFGSTSYLPTNFWSRFVSGGVHLNQWAGFAGILVTIAVAAAVARWRIGRDVTV